MTQQPPEENELAQVALKNYIALQSDISKEAAASLTEEIRLQWSDIADKMNRVGQLLLEAHERKAWQALGYTSWEAYVNTEFFISKNHSYRVLARADVFRHLTDAVTAAVTALGPGRAPESDSFQPFSLNQTKLSYRQAKAIKDSMPQHIAEIKRLVAQGMAPDNAVLAAIKTDPNSKSVFRVVEGRARQIVPEAEPDYQEASVETVARERKQTLSLRTHEGKRFYIQSRKAILLSIRHPVKGFLGRRGHGTR